MRILEKKRVRVDIMGRGFNLVSGENTDYIISVAKEVDAKMRELKDENPKLTYDTAAVLTALNLCDELMRLKNEAENDERLDEINKEDNKIRSQLVEYSKELSRATGTIKKLERELEKLKKESREKEEKVKREYEAKEKEILDMLDSM